MAKLTDFVTPTGQHGNVLSPSSWISLILGAVVFFVVVATGQNLVRKIPNNPVLDTTIEDPINRPMSAKPVETYGI